MSVVYVHHTKMAFLKFILSMYDKKFDSLFIYDCKCVNNKLSLDEIFQQRLSFMACVQLQGRTHHKFFPIMVGSKYHLTKHPDKRSQLKNSKGAFIINGELKILANTLINNINIFYSNKQQLLWNVNTTTQLIYKNGKVYKSREELKNGKTQRVVEPCENWRELIADSNKNHDEVLYKLLFDEIRENFPHIDNLSNKIVLTAPVLLEKVLNYLLSDEIKSKIATKKDLLTNGKITFIFSKQPFSKQSTKPTSQNAIEKKDSSIYISIDGHKIGRIKHFLTTTKRMIPQESMNSQPLQYPNDGELFICTLSCKEMKDAGLTLNWAQCVTTTIPVDLSSETQRIIYFMSSYLGEFYLVVNCIIQPVRVAFSFDIYLLIKKNFPNCNIFKYEHFIHILFIENIPVISYVDSNDNLRVYVTPNECANIFPKQIHSKFTLNDNFCLLYNELTPYTKHSLPPKITVSLNNWKGACYNISDTSLVEYTAFIESPGYNTGIISVGDYTHLAHIQNKLLEDQIPKDNTHKPLPRLYTDKLNAENGEILLYVGFSEHGECVEDGFIVDKEFASARGPQLMVNVNFTIRLSSSTNQPLNAKQLAKMDMQYTPLNIMVDKTIIFGEIRVYNQNINIQQSKRIIVKISQINNQFVHTIGHIVENTLDTTYHISSRKNFQNFSIICSYHYTIPFGKGTKLCNSYGQKSEIAGVMDLGCYIGRRHSDNALIKPQILMGSISLIGRTPSGQALDMLSSPDVAFGPNGLIIAPMKFVCSSILSCTKIAPNLKRIDMLTGPNCFDGNELVATNLILNRQRNTDVSAPQKLQRALNLMALKGTTIQFKSNANYNFNSFVNFQ